MSVTENIRQAERCHHEETVRDLAHYFVGAPQVFNAEYVCPTCRALLFVTQRGDRAVVRPPGYETVDLYERHADGWHRLGVEPIAV
jgi:hypothetical protein